jgi:hypothetical protein
MDCLLIKLREPIIERKYEITRPARDLSRSLVNHCSPLSRDFPDKRKQPETGDERLRMAAETFGNIAFGKDQAAQNPKSKKRRRDQARVLGSPSSHRHRDRSV